MTNNLSTDAQNYLLLQEEETKITKKVDNLSKVAQIKVITDIAKLFRERLAEIEILKLKFGKEVIDEMTVFTINNKIY